MQILQITQYYFNFNNINCVCLNSPINCIHIVSQTAVLFPENKKKTIKVKSKKC